MKPITKFFLILCSVLILLGFTGIGVSIAMGVQPAQLLDLAHYPGKFNEQKLEIIDDIEAALGTDTDSSRPKTSYPESDAEEYYEFRDIEQMDFDFNVCTLDIQTHGKDYITLEAQNVSNTFQCRQEENTLFLKDERTYLKEKDVREYGLQLKLCVPEKSFKDIDITVDAGNITIGQLSAKNMAINGGAGTFLVSALSGDNMDIDIGSGELTVGALSGKDITLDIGVGNLKADSISVSEDCSIDSGTGNVTLNQYDGKNLDISCGVGNVSVLASGKKEHYNYSLDCGVGNIRLSHELHTEGHHHQEHDDLGCHMDIQNNADRDIRIDCGLGDLELNFMEEE